MAGNYNIALGGWVADANHTGANSIAANASFDGVIQTNDGQLGTEVGIDIGYGATITGGAAIAYVCREKRAGVFEAVAESPAGFSIAVAASVTLGRNFFVPASIGRFIVRVFNPATNSTITSLVWYRPQKGAY